METWQYGFIITSGIMLQLILCGLILRQDPVEASVKDSNNEVQLQEIDPDQEPCCYNNEPIVEKIIPPAAPTKNKTCNLVLYSLHNLCWNFTVFGFFTVIPLFLDHKHFNVTEIALLISIFSFLVIIGRCTSAIFCIWKTGDRIFLYNLATFLSGIAILLFILNVNLTSYCTFAAFYGFCFGIQTAFVPIVTVDIFGHSNINKYLGIVIFATGLGGLISPYASGWFIDIVQRYDLIFIGGALPIFLCCFFIVHLHWPFKRCCDKLRDRNL